MTAFLNFLLIAGAVQGFIFNIATFLSRRKIEKPVLFLNLFILFFSLNNLQSWLIDKGYIASTDLWNQLTIPWYVLIVPMFYAFLVYYLEIEEHRWPLLRLTLAIFLLECIARYSVWYSIQNGALEPDAMRYYNNLEDIVTLGYSFFLYLKCYRIVYYHKDIYPHILSFDNLSWVKWFLTLGGVLILFWVFAILVNIFSDRFGPPESYYPLRIGSFFLIYWSGYQAFFQYVILKDRIVLRKKLREDQTSDSTVGTENELTYATESEVQLFQSVDQYIRTQQRFLDPNFGMEGLSEEIQVSTSSLSKAVNTQSGQHFSDYINGFRIDRAKTLLADPEFSNYTIVAIGLECGFNSKSAFYTAFKKLTGTNPTSFRKQKK